MPLGPVSTNIQWPYPTGGTPPYVDPRRYAGSSEPYPQPYWTQQSMPAPQGPSGSQVAQQTGKIGGDAIKGIVNASKMPGGITNWGGGAGGTLGSVAAVGGGALGAGMGIYDMMKAKTMGQNVVGGLKSGAGVGTMIAPGIGTAIGAGAGALAGFIKGKIQAHRQENAGRKAGVDAFGDITRGASQDQLNAAQNEVASGHWKNVKDPLTLIVMRDHFIKQGMDPEMANQQSQKFVKGMWDAEKKGADAVRSAAPNPFERYF